MHMEKGSGCTFLTFNGVRVPFLCERRADKAL